jgi:hypothetical protein
VADEQIDPKELSRIAGEAAKGRKVSDLVAAQLSDSEAERTRKLREENLAFRQQVERLSLSLLNASAIDDTYKFIEKKFAESEERFKRLEGLIGNLDGELKNQKMIQVRALQATYGHGSTTE